MALQLFTNERLNCLKFAYIVLNEFPKALRQTFKQKWNKTFELRPGFQPWDDSDDVRNLFLDTEGGTSKVPTHLSYDEWDCTALFQATIYARSFALPDSHGHHRRLHDLYLNSRKLSPKTFHSSVVSPTGDEAETFTLAIDQLRLLRNFLCHLYEAKLDKKDFDMYVQLAKAAIKALGVDTDPIDAVGSLTESDFPTEKVKKLEDELQRIKEFLAKEVIGKLQRLEEDNEELKKKIESANAITRNIIETKCTELQLEIKLIREDNKYMLHLIQESHKEENTASERRMINRMNEFNQGMRDRLREPQSPGFKPRFSRLNLPSHFTGREKECEEIIGHLTTDSTRIVSVWGLPGFGKTTTAIAVGQRLQKRGLPVYFISLRGLNSKNELMSKLLTHFRTDKSAKQDFRVKDEICFIFERLSDLCVLILDNVDDLLECGKPMAKKESLDLLKDILDRSEKVKFLLTTRESMDYLSMSLRGFKSTRIGELDCSSSEALVKSLIPEVSSSNAKKISQMCGQMPFAIWLLCNSLPNDSVRCTANLDELMLSESSLLELMDNPVHTSDVRLETLFESSFQRLSSQDQKALVSLSVISETFDLEIATAVLGLERSVETRMVLRRLQERALIDRCSNSDKFSIQKLLQSFAKNKGRREMEETILNANTRFLLFYIDLAEKLNEMFLTGQSMKALIDFFDNERSIVKSLMDGCTNDKVADRVFQVLAKAEFFLATAFYHNELSFDKIFQSAVKAASQLERSVLHRQLLQSKAFGYMTWGESGITMALLSEARRLQSLTTTICPEEKGKHLCYFGIYQLVVGKTEDGIRSLEEAISLLNNTAEHKVLKLMVFQILAIFYRCTKVDYEESAKFFEKAVRECREVGDMHLLVIPDNNEEAKKQNEDRVPPSTENLGNEPTEIGVIYLVVSAIRKLCLTEITDFLIKLLLRILQGIESTNEMTKPGWFKFQANAITMLSTFHKYEEGLLLTQKLITYSLNSLQKGATGEEDVTSSLSNETLAEWYLLQGKNQHCLRHFSEACTSTKHALTIILKLFGEKHEKTADVYSQLGYSQYRLRDYDSAAKCHECALDIRIQFLGKEHRKTADSYHDLGETQYTLRDYTSAAKSHKQALSIRQTVLGEDHKNTADSHFHLGATQCMLRDYTSATESLKRALEIRQNVLGEDHESTADSYHTLGETQYMVKDYTSATESLKRALEIRRMVLSKDHEKTANTYVTLGDTQFMLKDYTSATESHKQALNIRQNVLGENHEKTTESYHKLGETQYMLKDYTSAAESLKQALNISQDVLGKDHEKTADSHFNLGVTQNMLKDYNSATKSHRRALEIRQNVLGEDHEKTADSSFQLGVAQFMLKDYISSAESFKRALNIRQKVLSEDHEKTADCHFHFGLTQYMLRDYNLAFESHQQALKIRQKVLVKTADSYHQLGETQYMLEDYTSATESYKRAIEIKQNLLGEDQGKTADSYHELGKTQYMLNDNTSATKSYRRALNIRQNVLGEDHEKTADSSFQLGVAQFMLKDYTSSAESFERALNIRQKVLNEDHEKTADCHFHFGLTQYRLRDYNLAFESHQQALKIREKVLVKDHEKTADSYHQLGETQYMLEDYTSATESYKRAIEIKQNVLGEDHGKTADSYHELGETQYMLKDYTSATKSYRRALNIRQKVLGEDHVKTADSYSNLGVAQFMLEYYTSSAKSLERALKIRKKVLGEDHEKTADSYFNLGAIQCKLEDYTSSAESYQQALKIRKKVLGEDHEKTADSYFNLGAIQCKLEDYTSSAESYQQALKIRKKVLGEDHEKTVDCYIKLSILITLRDYNSDTESLK